MATTQSVAGCANIPSAWKVVPLEDVAFFQEGPGLRKWQWTDSGMKVINVTNLLGDGQVDTDNTSRFISLDEFNQRYRHFAVDDRDIVVASSGNTYGKVGRISAKNLPVMMNTSVIRFHAADEARLDDDYLYSFLRSEIFKNQIESFVTGSAQPNFGPSHLKQMVMPLPPLPVQRRIAGILSAYDELMENSQRRIRLLEAMARALYREWFVHFRFPGHEKHPRVASPLGDIPPGWEDKSLADLMDMRGGSQPEKSEFVYEEQEGYVRLIQIRDFESDSHLTFVRESSKLRLCKPSDIMIARYGASVARVCSGLAGAYNVALVKVVPLVPNCQEFLREFLSDDDFQKRLIGMSGRAAQNGFNKSDIASVRVPVPRDPSLLERFERFAVPNRNAIQNLHDKIQNLRRTRDLLLPRLLSGQVELKTEAV